MTPALSVVLTTRSGWPPLERTVRCLAEQTIADRIELVVVSFPPGELGPPPPETERLGGGLRVVRLDGHASVATANAEGALAATAPVVAFGEDHSYPVADWAEALLDRHAEGWAVVGPVMRNATPRSAVSWTDWLLGYGLFGDGHPGGEVDFAPGHNSSYKREVLERHAGDLRTFMAAEWVFHRRLREEGERVCIEPRAVTRHVSFGFPVAAARTTFLGGWAGAAVRAHRWPLLRRLVYAAGTPLLPALRAYRFARRLAPEQRRRIPFARILPVLAAGLVLDAAGQAVGFLRPSRDAARDAEHELERLRFVHPADIARLPCG